MAKADVHKNVREYLAYHWPARRRYEPAGAIEIARASNGGDPRDEARGVACR